MPEMKLILGDCLTVLPTLPAGSIDAIITDPPYPCIERSYGYWTEAEWFALMKPVVLECRRILKPTGSAVFVLQPNSERVGRMRTWLWEFMLWVGKEWGIVQDVWWWNPTMIPGRQCHKVVGLTRQSVKACVWIGKYDCYRSQDEVLLEPGDWVKVSAKVHKMRRYIPAGYGVNEYRCAELTLARGGSTPFNLLPIPNADSQNSAGANGHGAGTPLALCDWWTRYICPPGGVILDPFMGTATTGLAALKHGCDYIGIERIPEYHTIAEQRLGMGLGQYPLFPEPPLMKAAGLFDAVEAQP